MSQTTSTFRAGEILFKEGSESNSLYLVKVGRVSIRKGASGGAGAVEIAQIGPNQVIGEVGFFDRRPRSAEAVALTYCEVVEIPYTALAPMFDPSPDYIKRIMSGLAMRLRDADEIIRKLKERLGENTALPSGEAEDENAGSSESDTAKILRQTE